jgi:hypothetical protein
MADEAQMVGDSHMRRMDLVALRMRIQNALGQEKWPKYWSLLQRFMRFKLSKEELDNDARAVSPCAPAAPLLCDSSAPCPLALCVRHSVSVYGLGLCPVQI